MQLVSMCFCFRLICGCDCSCLEPAEDWSISQDSKSGELGAGKSLFNKIALVIVIQAGSTNEEKITVFGENGSLLFSKQRLFTMLMNLELIQKEK